MAPHVQRGRCTESRREWVIVMTFVGSEAELETLEITARVSAEAMTTGLPVLSEAILCTYERIPVG